jgi:ribosome-associated protein
VSISERGKTFITMKSTQIKKLVITALEDMKAKDLVTLDVRKLTSVTDYMVIASGSSNRHVKSMAGNVVSEAKKQGLMPVGVEGENAGDWVLVDFGGVLVHIMLPDTRAFYDLERLWSAERSEEEVL